MVIMTLQGGLGNQMFQYATAVGSAREGEAIFLNLQILHEDAKGATNHTPRLFSLNIFEHLQAKITPQIVHSIFNRTGPAWRAARRLASTRVKRIAHYSNKFLPGLQHHKSSVYLEGYFQSEKYFRNKRERLMTEFDFPELDEANKRTAAEISGRGNPVSLHIRRGDYLEPKFLNHHGIPSLDYYTNSIRQIEAKISDPHYYIFSEDVDWCREHLGFLGHKMTLIGDINSREGWKDMCLMTHCRHHIVANSSFSWWGAWLARQDGLKFAPAEWFNSKNVTFDVHDFVPEAWTIVHYA